MKKSELLKHLELFEDDDEVSFRFDSVTLDFESVNKLDKEGCIYLSSENYFAEYDESFEDDYYDPEDYTPYVDFEEYPH